MPIWLIFVIMYLVFSCVWLFVELKKAKVSRGCENCPEVYFEGVQMFIMKRPWERNTRKIVGRCCVDDPKMKRAGWRNVATFVV